jgi:hypothetical protein
MARGWNIDSRNGSRALWSTAALAAALSVAPVAPALTVQPGAPAISPPPVIAPPTAIIRAGGPGQQRIIEAVERRYNAKVVRVTETTVNGRPALELRLLSDQRVWNVVVDAESGQELSRS